MIGFRMSNYWVCNLYLDFFLTEEGMAYGGLQFPDTRCPVPGVYF